MLGEDSLAWNDLKSMLVWDALRGRLTESITEEAKRFNIDLVLGPGVRAHNANV